MIRALLTCLTLSTALTVITVLASPARAKPLPQAQSAATPTPIGDPAGASTSYLVARADLSGLPSGSSTITAATVILAPGFSTQPFANPGPTVIGVQEGQILLTADAVTISNVMISSIIGVQVETAPPSPVVDALVRQNQQIIIPAGARATISGDGDRPARLLVISIIPAEAAP